MGYNGDRLIKDIQFYIWYYQKQISTFESMNILAEGLAHYVLAATSSIEDLRNGDINPPGNDSYYRFLAMKDAALTLLRERPIVELNEVIEDLRNDLICERESSKKIETKKSLIDILKRVRM